MGETQYPIDLTENEREKLEAITSYGRHSAQKITRARILLKADEGESDSAIAEALDCSRSTAWRTRKKFHQRDRIEAIERKNPDRDYDEKLDDMRWISPIQPAPDRRICKGHSVTSRKRSRKRRTGSHRSRYVTTYRAFPKL
jgi:hypothetical protein